jgi:hypothetical protein
MAAVDEEAPRCVNHPRVETWVSCSSCGRPICPDCMVQAPVGLKCRDCARMPRGARVRVRPQRLVAATATAIGLGLAGGVLLASLAGGSIGFVGFIVAFFIAMGIGEGVLRASGRARGGLTGYLAGGGALLAYVSPLLLVRWLYDERYSSQSAVLQVAFGLFAAYIAWRQVQ